MTQRRSMTFDPPLAVPLNDGAEILIRSARHAAGRLYATLQIWNDHLIYADEVAIDQARQREQFIRGVLAHYPALDKAVLAQAVLNLVDALPPLMHKAPAGSEASPPLIAADAQTAHTTRPALPNIAANQGDLCAVAAETWEAIQQANAPTPQFFRHGGGANPSGTR